MIGTEGSLAEVLDDVRVSVHACLCVVHPAITDDAQHRRLHTGKQLECQHAAHIRNVAHSQGRAMNILKEPQCDLVQLAKNVPEP